jgi:hypothetical protein
VRRAALHCLKFQIHTFGFKQSSAAHRTAPKIQIQTVIQRFALN